MPRPDKQINSRGPLYAPVSSSRAVVWKKHAGPETAEVSDEPSPAMEITIDDLTVSTVSTQAAPPPDGTSKWVTRATSAQLPRADDVADSVAMGSGTRREPQPTRTEWVVTRSIEGRTYRRSDALTTVDEHSGS